MRHSQAWPPASGETHSAHGWGLKRAHSRRWRYQCRCCFTRPCQGEPGHPHKYLDLFLVRPHCGHIKPQKVLDLNSETLILSTYGIFLIFRNNFNGFWNLHQRIFLGWKCLPNVSLTNFATFWGKKIAIFSILLNGCYGYRLTNTLVANDPLI
jgi:hypothetical protein